MKLYCPVLAVLFAVAIGVAAGAAIDNQYPKVGKTISGSK